MLNKIYIVIYLAIFIAHNHAKIFSRCDLAEELLAQGFPCDLLPDWVCLIEAESARNTSALGILNGRGKFYHGLFQINEEYWCTRKTPGGGCNVTCESLTSDDISIAAACALKMYNRRGFEQWAGWKVKCKEKQPNLSECSNQCS